MYSDFDTRFKMVNDCEQLAIDTLERYSSNDIGRADYYCSGTNNTEHVISCTVKQKYNGNRVHTFTLNGKRIARHKIALRLGELGV